MKLERCAKFLFEHLPVLSVLSIIFTLLGIRKPNINSRRLFKNSEFDVLVNK